MSSCNGFCFTTGTTSTSSGNAVDTTKSSAQQQQQRCWNMIVFLLLIFIVVSSPQKMYQINAFTLQTLPYHPTRSQSRSSSSYYSSISIARSATTGTSITPPPPPPPPPPSSSSSSSSSPTPEELQNEIIELREIATHRLEALLEQMEDLKRMNAIYKQQQLQQQQQQQRSIVVEKVEDLAVHSAAKNDSTPSKVDTVTTTTADVIPSSTTSTTSTTTGTTPTTSTPTPPVSLNLLDDTTWKIVYNIGREKGTWMPKDWGVSGDRLLFQCTVQFTKEPIQRSSSSQQYQDEFFHAGLSSPTPEIKQLRVIDAFLIPRGVGDASVGRRPIPVQTIGAYKVCQHQGPGGTDIVRFYIELNDIVTVPDHTSDVYCPSGRIYATCGYFPIQSSHDPIKCPSKREIAHEKYKEALRDYEHIQVQIDTDTRGLLNMDHIKLLQKAWTAKQRLDEMASQLRHAQQQEPERSQLRLNSDQTIGLTREGGVCCKVHKGLALEYHILGKIEVGCMNHH